MLDKCNHVTIIADAIIVVMFVAVELTFNLFLIFNLNNSCHNYCSSLCIQRLLRKIANLLVSGSFYFVTKRMSKEKELYRPNSFVRSGSYGLSL